MPTLEIGIDASRFTAGVQQVQQSTDVLLRSMDRSATSVNSLGKAMSSAFQFTGGSVQIAQGIAQTARSFGELNAAAGAFSASRVLLEIGQTARDFGNLRAAVGGTASVWGVLGGVLRANPIGLLATGIGLAATSMSLLGESTRRTATDFEALAASVDKARVGDLVNRNIGTFSDLTRGAQLDAIRGTLAGIHLGDTPTIGSLGTLLGTDPRATANLLAMQGNRHAIEFLGDGSFSLPTGTYTQFGPQMRRSSDLSELPLNGEQARGILESQAQHLLNRPLVSGGTESWRGPLGSGYSSMEAEYGLFGPGTAGYGRPANLVDQSQEDRQRVEAENFERAAQASERIAHNFEQMGQTMGAMMGDFLFGATTLRQTLANMTRAGANSALQAGFGAAFGALGKTIAQSGADSGIAKPGESKR